MHLSLQVLWDPLFEILMTFAIVCERLTKALFEQLRNQGEPASRSMWQPAAILFLPCSPPWMLPNAFSTCLRTTAHPPPVASASTPHIPAPALRPPPARPISIATRPPARPSPTRLSRPVPPACSHKEIIESWHSNGTRYTGSGNDDGAVALPCRVDGRCVPPPWPGAPPWSAQSEELAVPRRLPDGWLPTSTGAVAPYAPLTAAVSPAA